MKILSLTIKNIGIIEDCTIAFDKPLLLFFGDIRQGKTTILNAVKWCFGGSFPGDILRHGPAVVPENIGVFVVSSGKIS